MRITRRSFLATGAAFAACESIAGDSPDAFAFVQATDLHSSETSEMTGWERGALELPEKYVHGSFIDDINALSDRPAFAVFTGDLISHTSLDPSCWPRAVEKWRRYRRLITDRLQIPFHQILGNNDCAAAPYQEVFPDRPLRWSFTRGRILFVGLHGYDCWKVENSNHAGIKYGPDQLAWLGSLVAESEARTLVLFTHEPLASLDSRLAVEQLAPILSSFRGEAVWNLCGHEHVNCDEVLTIGGRRVRCVQTRTPVGSWKPGDGDYRVFFCSDGLLRSSVLRTCTPKGVFVAETPSPNWENPPAARTVRERFPADALAVLLPGEGFPVVAGSRKVQDRLSNYYIACAGGDGWYPLAKSDSDYEKPGRLVFRVPRCVGGRTVRRVWCLLAKGVRSIDVPDGSGPEAEIVLENGTGKCDFKFLGCALLETPTEDWKAAFRRAGFDPGAPGSSYFIVTGDVHAPTQDANLAAHVDFWNAMDPKPAFVAVLGDLGWVNQYFGHRPSPEQAAAKAAESFGTINAAVTTRLSPDVAPVYVVGNHDTYPGEDDRGLWRAHFPGQAPYAAYDFCGIRFLKWDGGGDGMISAEQEAWIKSACAACPGDRSVVVLVHQPSVGSTAAERDIGRVAREALSGRVGDTWMLAGHRHANGNELWDLPGGGRLMVATHTRDIDGWWAYGVRDGRIVARIFKPESELSFRIGKMPDELKSRGGIPTAFEGRDDLVWKAFVGTPEERALRVSIGRSGDNGGALWYVENLRYRFPKSSVAPTARTFAVLGSLRGHVKTGEPAKCFLSADGESWVQVPCSGERLSVNEFPIPEGLVGAEFLHVRYESFGFSGGDSIAAFAFLR